MTPENMIIVYYILQNKMSKRQNTVCHSKRIEQYKEKEKKKNGSIRKKCALIYWQNE